MRKRQQLSCGHSQVKALTFSLDRVSLRSFFAWEASSSLWNSFSSCVSMNCAIVVGSSFFSSSWMGADASVLPTFECHIFTLSTWIHIERNKARWFRTIITGMCSQQHDGTVSCRHCSHLQSLLHSMPLWTATCSPNNAPTSSFWASWLVVANLSHERKRFIKHSTASFVSMMVSYQVELRVPDHYAHDAPPQFQEGCWFLSLLEALPSLYQTRCIPRANSPSLDTVSTHEQRLHFKNPAYARQLSAHVSSRSHTIRVGTFEH